MADLVGAQALEPRARVLGVARGGDDPRERGADELVGRDKCSLDLFRLKDESLLDAENLPEPDVIAAEIAEDLRSALEQIEEILGDLGEGAGAGAE